MRWWYTENGGRQPYPFSCLAAIAVTVLYTLSILQLCVTLSLANEFAIDLLGHIPDPDPSGGDPGSDPDLIPSGKLKTDQRDPHGHADGWDDSVFLTEDIMDNGYRDHVNPILKLKYNKHRVGHQRESKSVKKLTGPDLGELKQKGYDLLKSFCNKTKTRTLSRCVECSVTKPCLDSKPQKSGNCVLRGNGGLLPQSGCSYICKMVIPISECCPGYWGSQCLECPGGTNNVCNGRGQCGDGIGGNGQCQCNAGFMGVACELCERNNTYGQLCIQECQCIHGTCNSGPLGDGSCLCKPGYQGIYCDEEDNVCANLMCHPSAHCELIPSTLDLRCVCNPGYEGNGLICQEEIIHCGDLVCNQQAFCSVPGNCVCNRGFYGDGVDCIPMNHCQERNGNCPIESSFCLYDGPGEFHCECRHGYENFQLGQGCTVIDMCSNQDVPECPVHSTCIMERPGQTSCQCQSGYVSVGAGCYGNIMERLKELSSTGGVGLQGQLHTSITMLESTGLATLLTGNHFFTLIIPTDDAFLEPEMQPIVINAELVPDFADYLMKLHILPTYLNSSALNTTRDVYTMTGLKAEIMSSSKDYSTLRYRVEGSNNRGIITHKDLLASNGIIHVIDTLLYEKSAVETNITASVFELISQYGCFNRLQNALQLIGLDSVIHGPGYMTFLAPYNKAFNDLPEGVLDFLFSVEGRSKLEALLHNHIIVGEMLRTQDLLNLPTNFHLRTMHDSSLIIRRASNGQISINNAANVTITDVKTKNGIVHVIDALLIPSDILPLLPHICDTFNQQSVQGICGSCDDDKLLRCPEGATPIELRVLTSMCVYEDYIDGVVLHEPGCKLNCTTTIVIKQCCSGFYGDTCRSCPGGFQTPCSGHGQCNDGSHGNGSCVCNVNFYGTACELCSTPNHYGQACDQSCSCVHGVCDSGPHGTGQCIPNSCDIGFTGDNCDQHITPCGFQQDLCHAHATCYDDGVQIRCICNAGYDGNGEDCIPINVCEQPARGNCHQEATCTYLAAGVHRCDCNELWEGDGYVCIPFDPCTRDDHGGCHSNATCIYVAPRIPNSCECKPGFSGTGQYCEPINICNMGNGGCHPQAECENVDPGQVECRCREGYKGDGYSCYSNVAVELATLPIAHQFYTLIQRAGLEGSLVSSQALTIFVPGDAAFESLTAHQRSLLLDSDEDYIEHFVRKHIIFGSYLEQQLYDVATNDDSWLPTWFDTFKLLISTCGQMICVDQNKARVGLSDILASNGVIHFIDKILLIEDEGTETATFIPNLPKGSPLPEAMKSYSNYKNFTYVLAAYGLLDLLNQEESYTLFVPVNSAVASWDVSRMNLDVLKFHIVIGERLETSDLYDGLRVDSLLGHNFPLQFHVDNSWNTRQFYVNQIPIVLPNIPTDKGVVHGLMEVLNPIPNRCDYNRTSYIPSPCKDCNFLPDCPVGSIPMDHPTESNCQYTEELFGRPYQRAGCTVQCNQVQFFPHCCNGFYGSECDECPGGWVVPCYGHGTCMDGVNGTGQCVCQPGFAGTSCEQCETDRYASQCDQECQCVNGLCSDGIRGDGHCQCDQGWTGQHCNISSDMNSCQPECDVNAYCVDGRCACYSGYTGDGYSCAEFDVCTTVPCAVYGRCISHGQGRYSCQCNIGYEGDGVICREVNPCVTGQSGCHHDAECIHTGPAVSVCVCLPGYYGDGRIRCDTINPCSEDNGGCAIRAVCNHTGPNQRECRCFEGHVGDGFTCTGNLLAELAMINEVSKFYYLMEADTRLRQLLANGGPFTLFVPTNDALQRISEAQHNEWKNNDQLIDILLYHTISCEAADSHLLWTKSSWNTVIGQSLTVTHSQEDGFRLNGGVQIVTPDIGSTNGIMHIIDTLLVPTLTLRGPNVEIPSFEELARSSNYTIFLQLMQKAGVDAEFNNPLHVPATLFVPNDAAFGFLPPDKLIQLNDVNNKGMLTEFVQYHFVPSQKLHVSDFAATPGGQRFTTLQGSQISIGCMSEQIIEGGIYINEKSRLVDFERHFQEGLLFGIDRVLEPPSIGGRCDHTVITNMMTPCSSCNTEFQCPLGFYPKGTPLSNCQYTPSWFVVMDGCKQECTKEKRIPMCCENYYGSDCRECPGGSRTPCEGHGMCHDGHDGDGHCECDLGFTGTACELCMAGRYGHLCTECQCHEHGICRDGMHGSGSCFCHQGWTGVLCDSALVVEPKCDPLCHQNAVCREGNQCECYPHYHGNGYDCTVINQCAFNNGGCSPYANCVSNNVNLTCVCRVNYEGDGVSCQPIDKCQVNNGGCHASALCTFTGPNTRSCQCLLPFVGNGIQCEPPKGQIPQCFINNGGCSENAHCISGGAISTTPSTLPLAEYSPGVAQPRTGLYKSKRRKREDSVLPYLPNDNDPHSIHCVCKEGYIGNGTLCNGNMLDTLASVPRFSNFYQAVILYAQHSNASDGELLLHTLQSPYSSLTVFVPMNEEFGNGTYQSVAIQTVPNYIVDMSKVSSDSFYDNMSLVAWMKHAVLTLEQIPNTKAQPHFTVNGVNITYLDIPTTNGFIHVVQHPLTFKSTDGSFKGNKTSGHTPSRIVALIVLAIAAFIIACIIGAVCVLYKVRKKRLVPNETVRTNYTVNPDDIDGTVTFSHTKHYEEGGDETDMTDTDDGGMDNPEYVVGDVVDDRVAFASIPVPPSKTKCKECRV